MDTKALRQKILDLAIHGKLVPQDPNDEPASVLLERIKAEKERLIKEGKIKRSKKSAKSSDTPHYQQDVPFEVPSNWVWTTLGSIGTWQAGGTPSRSNKSYYGGNIPWLKTGDLNDGLITNIPESITEEAVANSPAKINPTGSVLIAMYGATIGKLGMLTFPATTNQACCACIEYWGITQLFLFYFLLSHRDTFIAKGGGGAQPNISKEIIVNTTIPLPPLAEQERIVIEIEHWFALIDEIEQGKSDLQAVIKQAKSKILDLAIHGKLVPQDPNDEPASELLKRINPKAKITCDNGHYTFDVPSGWITTNLGSIFNVVSAKRILKSDWKHSGVPFYRAREIAKLSIYGLVDNELYISEEHYNSLKEKFPVPKASDIMISAVGTIGKCYIVKESDKFYYKDASVLCLCNDYQINAKYIYHIMRSEYMLKQMYDNSKGTTVDTITIEKAKQYILPLPPLAEQQRIVAKIEETFSIFDGIQNSLEA
ncbi:restriction endonuclease subunit S [Phocaeicola vulgatus]|uniref:restriction endonuclease subunit S n=1 Tax=Phocaeicola vulgatus TaxID=821 RepID=UPI00374E054A